MSINGISDLNKECDIFARRSKSKIESLKNKGSNKSNKELLEQIINEEHWNNWILSLQNKSEKFDLFCANTITKLKSNDLEKLSLSLASQKSDNFGFLSESCGWDDSLFIEKDGQFYIFDGAYIFEKAYKAIKRAVINQFPGEENNWNLVEEEKSGLLPISIFAGIFSHFDYTLGYEKNGLSFSAHFESSKKEVFIEVPRQHGYKIPLNPIKELELTKTALTNYDAISKHFSSILEPIIVVDFEDKQRKDIIQNNNIYSITYYYLASMLNDWNKIRLFRDRILGISDLNIEIPEQKKELVKKEFIYPTASEIDDENNDEYFDLDSMDGDNFENDIEDNAVGIDNEEYDGIVDDDEVEEPDNEVELEELDNEDELEELDNEDELEELYNEDELEDIEELPKAKVDKDIVKNNSLGGFSFFDVLNNVSKGKNPLDNPDEVEDTGSQKEIDLEATVNDNSDDSQKIVLNKDSDYVSVDIPSSNKIKEEKQEEKQEEKSAVQKSSGFSFFDVLNNVAKGKNPLENEMINSPESIEELSSENETKDNIPKPSIDTREEISCEDVEIKNDEVLEITNESDFNQMFKNYDFEATTEKISPIYKEPGLLIPDDISEIQLEDSLSDEKKENIDSSMDSCELNNSDAEAINNVNEILNELDSDDSDLENYGLNDSFYEEDEENLYNIDDELNTKNDYYDHLTDNNEDSYEDFISPSYNRIKSPESKNIIDNTESEEARQNEINIESNIDEKVSNSKKNEITNNFDEIVKDKEGFSIVTPSFKAIDEMKIIEEDVPTIESLWPKKIFDIIKMSENLDESPFFSICKENDLDLLEAMNHLIEQALELQVIDGKDKMFTIPNSTLTIILPTGTNDQLKKWQRMNSLGSLMYSNDKESWDILTLNYKDQELMSIKESSISRSSFSDVDWKFVVTTGSRLKKKKNRV